MRRLLRRSATFGKGLDLANTDDRKWPYGIDKDFIDQVEQRMLKYMRNQIARGCFDPENGLRDITLGNMLGMILGDIGKEYRFVKRT